MSTSIDSLSIQIEASSSAAAAQIDRLSTALLQLKSNAKMNTAVNSLTKLSTALQGLQSSSTALEGLKSLGETLNGLQSVGKVLELFAGTRSIGKAFEARGHEVFSVEWDKSFEDIDLYADILTVTAESILKEFGQPDVIWASPDCSTYSVAAISRHRRQEADGNLKAITEYAAFCDSVNAHVVDLIRELKPKYWFIENPRGALRKMSFMQGLPRYTVTYCKYGEKRMKPTDIWTNHKNPRFIPPCKNGDPCHESAPRGARTGTQGIQGSRDRARIPELLCTHIVDICESGDGDE